MSSKLIKPSLYTGYAKGPGKSENPNAWENAEFLFFPELGYADAGLHGLSRHGYVASFNNMDATNWEADQHGYHLTYNNVDEWMDFTPSIAATNHCTIICAMKPTARGAFDVVFGGTRDGSDGNKLQGMIFSSSTHLSYYWETNANEWDLSSGIVPAIGEWSLCTIVITPTQSHLYMLSEDGTFTVGTGVTQTHNKRLDKSGLWNIGRDTNAAGSRYYSGGLGGTGVFSRSFTESQVREMAYDWLGRFRLESRIIFKSPSGDKTVTPSAQALTLALESPTINISGSVTVAPSVQSLTLALPAPVIVIDTTVTPATQTLTLTQETPAIDAEENVTITPAALSLTLTPETPTVDVSGNVTLSPSAQTLTLALPVPTIDITGSIIVTPSAQVLTLTPETPTIKIDVTVFPSAQVLTLSQGIPSVSIGADIIVSLPALALVLTPEAVTVTSGVTVLLEALTLALTQEGPDLSIDTTIIMSGPLALVLSLPSVTITTPTAPPLSVRKEIIAAIIAQLKTITIVNGYNTEIGSSVKDWQVSNISMADLPMIEINDTGETSEIKGQYHYNILTVEIIGKIATASIDNARDLQKDIVVAMVDRPSFPLNVYHFLPADKPELLPEKADKQVVSITLSYEIKYREKLL
jgi:hypothetical protein